MSFPGMDIESLPEGAVDDKGPEPDSNDEARLKHKSGKALRDAVLTTCQPIHV